MLAPILVTVYNRSDHFKRCIESLKRCELASSSVLYISSDAAYRKEDEKEINIVRQYSKEIQGFKKVILLFQSENKGLMTCYNDSFEEILKESDRIIFLEDDIIVSPDFLKYMNDCLEFYKDEKQVYSISAFSSSIFYPQLIKEETEVYFTHRFNPWGFGIWKDRLLTGGEYSLDDVKNSLREPEFIKKLNNIGADLYPAFLSAMAQKKMLALDYLNVFHMVKNNLVTVTPYHLKSFNIGNDGSGTRTKKIEKYSAVNLSLLEKEVRFSLALNIQENINDSFNRIGHNSIMNNIKLGLYKTGFLSMGVKVNNLIRKLVRGRWGDLKQ
jgi:glycosyltransferase involved in cell wall biosynthesis